MLDWFMMIPSIVFTRVKNDFSTQLKESLAMTDENFSTTNSVDKPPEFPFVCVQNLVGYEIGADLERDVINGQDFTFQVDVTDNISQNRARNVMGEVVRIMKTMSFLVEGTPFVETTGGTHRYIARFRRRITRNDYI